jgi:hypothetical protein
VEGQTSVEIRRKLVTSTREGANTEESRHSLPYNKYVAFRDLMVDWEELDDRQRFELARTLNNHALFDSIVRYWQPERFHTNR